MTERQKKQGHPVHRCTGGLEMYKRLRQIHL